MLFGRLKKKAFRKVSPWTPEIATQIPLSSALQVSSENTPRAKIED